MMSSLGTYFKGSASKYLTKVDVKGSSNQHEIGSNKFTAFLGVPEGGEKLRFEATFLRFTEESDAIEVCVDSVVYYDTRHNQPGRSPEFRLYYRDNDVTVGMAVGDFLLVALQSTGTLLIAIASARGTHERRLRHLFDINKMGTDWQVDEKPSEAELDFASTGILDALGIQLAEPSEVQLGSIVDRFGLEFPSTTLFSAFARETCPDEPSATDDPDAVLEAWMRHEERLFRTLEGAIVGTRVTAGFESVDEFVTLSLSVQNRRKSRVGHALEHHLQEVFKRNNVRHARGVRTEGQSRPDFLFPSASAYRDEEVGSPPLQMLAAKSTCKDRWRQVLVEAARIPRKHLFTLETAISENQTAEMQSHALQLVVPPSVAKTYTNLQQAWLLSLKDFVDLVKH